MQTKLVNIYKDKYDVYIGRAGKGQDGTFGNPFDKGTREENIAQFKTYFLKRVKEDKEFAFKVSKLKGKILGCFCVPKLCHGNIIIDYLNTLPETKPIKAAIIGSRSFSDYAYMKEILIWYDITEVISGGATGADSYAEKFADENKIPKKIFKPDWNKHGKQAGFIRNKLIVQNCDEVIAFWNGTSKGTQHSINVAYELGKPVSIYWPKNKLDDLSDLGF